MGQTTITNEELEAMLDRAARKGAKEALASIGLLDDSAQKDITEMRSLLEAWRDTRKSIWNTVNKSNNSLCAHFYSRCSVDELR